MKRFLAAISLSLALIFIGVKWSQRPSEETGLDLSLSFRSMQRLVYDEAHLRTDRQWRTESVTGTLQIGDDVIQVLLEALPTNGMQVLSAINVEVNEDQNYDYRDLVLVRKDSEEAQVILAPPAGPPLMDSKLRLNGKVIGEYILVVQPFYAALMRGEGPLARKASQGLILSAHSAEFVLMKKLAKENAERFPEIGEYIWAVWNDQEKVWRPWGRWPEGWAL